jgi:hypothetical protein
MRKAPPGSDLSTGAGYHVVPKNRRHPRRTLQAQRAARGVDSL